MKPSLIVLAPAVIIASLALPALGQEPRPTLPDSTTSLPASILPTRSSELVGLEVRNYQDEKLGKVQDLVIDLSVGRLSGLLVSVGGVLGIGDRSVLVPWIAFHYDTERKVLHLDRAKSEFEATARDLNPSRSPAQVGTETLPADPAVADPTVTDQGNNERDLLLTAQIRQDVLRQPDLSISGQNVKIITVNGRVTLRGAVATEDERQLIARLAETAAPGQVDNQLEVTSLETNR